jgi:hypothetical protein
MARRVLHLFPSRPRLILAAVMMLMGLPIRDVLAAEFYAPEIAAASQRFAIPEPWIRAVMRVESAGDRRAVSHRGAMGLMQVMPSTWAALRIRHGLGEDPFAPQDNVLAGTAYLREMLDRFGSVPLMLAAYNAGPGRVDEHLATGRSLPAETRAYVATATPLLTGGDPGAAPTPPVVHAQLSTRVLFVPLHGDRLRQTPAPDATVFAQIARAGPVEGVARGGLFVRRRDDDAAP